MNGVLTVRVGKRKRRACNTIWQRERELPVVASRVGDPRQGAGGARETGIARATQLSFRELQSSPFGRR